MMSLDIHYSSCASALLVRCKGSVFFPARFISIFIDLHPAILVVGRVDKKSKTFSHSMSFGYKLDILVSRILFQFS